MNIPLGRRATLIGGESALRQTQSYSIQTHSRFLMFKRFSFVQVFCLALFTSLGAFAATVSTHTATTSHKSHSKSSHKITESASAQKKMSRMRHSSAAVAARNRSTHTVTARKHHYYGERFYASSFANDQVEGDITAGEDPIVRAAAIEALGGMNGTVVAMDPDNGRILAMVNQKLALSAGAQPCSTIKVAVALAALSENVITKDTQVPLTKTWHVDLTTALAHSNNAYFEAVGRKLGFEKVSYYAHQFGLGELAGWNIPNEHLGTFPSTELDEKLGGVGKMCSFGESISLTPLQLAALMGAIANGGTLYYLQHPGTPGWHGRCGSVRHCASAEIQLHGRAGARKNGHLLERRHALRLVRIVREHAVRSHRDCGLPGRRSPDLRSQGRGAGGHHVPQPLRSQLFCGEESAG